MAVQNDNGAVAAEEVQDQAAIAGAEETPSAGNAADGVESPVAGPGLEVAPGGLELLGTTGESQHRNHTPYPDVSPGPLSSPPGPFADPNPSGW